MIGYIRGSVLEILPASGQILVETPSGLGYFVAVRDVFQYTKHNDLSLFTFHVQREDKVELFGFDSLEDRMWVEKLLKVSGVGPKMAAIVVFQLGAEKIQTAIREMDVKQFEVVKGLGGKTAKKILLELKGIEFSLNDDSNTTKDSPILRDFVDTLDNLGYKKPQALKLYNQLQEQKLWKDDNLVDMVKLAITKNK
jgi:holliday junction DNA helicase RuvA